MAEPLKLYEERLRRFEAQLQAEKKKLLASSMLRLSVFLLACGAVYFLWGSVQWIALSILLFFIIFFFLVNRHVNIQQRRDWLIALIDINQTEIDVLHRKFAQLPEGSEFINDLHPFSQDIDLFGKGSFFQYLNRTTLKKGKERLADLLTSNDNKNIQQKQEAIRELKTQIDFRQSFSALARLTHGEENEPPGSLEQKLEHLKTHIPFTPAKAVLISSLFSGISTLLIILFFTHYIPYWIPLSWLFIGLGITGLYTKRVNALSHKVDELQKVFQQYHRLISLLENIPFSSSLLTHFQDKIQTEDEKASAILKKFSRTIDALDQRGNLLFGFLGNGFLLWDIHQSSKLEKWIQKYMGLAEGWFAILADIDAYNTLGNFAFNHPDFVYPTITHSTTLIKANGAVHPLIPPQEAVRNDFEIKKGEFFIITGANMAGKSTFLRTVALQIVMSNTGLPIRVTSCEYTPIKLITSMRTTDSLAEESSYFYAELSRLKFIIDQLQKEDYFIVLDEILKGTNSKDKAIGSQRFLEKLVRVRSTGIIATHDLSLCTVAEGTDNIKNHYFDAQITNDELFFDYKFKKGICQNMNASFLLKKMKIID